MQESADGERDQLLHCLHQTPGAGRKRRINSSVSRDTKPSPIRTVTVGFGLSPNPSPGSDHLSWSIKAARAREHIADLVPLLTPSESRAWQLTRAQSIACGHHTAGRELHPAPKVLFSSLSIL